MLHHLGVYMGSDFHRAVRYCPKGTYEDTGLWRICTTAYRPPFTDRRVPRLVLVGWLKPWVAIHQQKAQEQGKPAGFKHPLLCAMVGELVMLMPSLRIISVVRPLDESSRSLESTSWWNATPLQYEVMQKFLWRQREVGLKDIDHLSLHYHDLLQEPAAQIDRIISYVGIDPDSHQRASALSFVDPGLTQFSS